MFDDVFQGELQDSLIQITNILDVKKYIDGLKAIVFDLDDTLYGEKEYVRSGYSKIAELFPWVKDCEIKMWKLFEAKKPAIDEFLKAEGLFTDKNKDLCLKAYRFQKPDIRLFPGVHEMLIQLKNNYKRTYYRWQTRRAKCQDRCIRDSILI